MGGARLTPLPWESEFFGRPMAALELSESVRVDEIATAIREGDAEGIDLVQCHLGPLQFHLAPLLEDVGFRLADTRAVFRTVVRPASRSRIDPPYGVLRQARSGDLADLLALTIASTVDNDGFVSRYKNRRWFSRSESERYFEAWVAGNLDDPGTLSCVWDVDDEVAGYFLYSRSGENDGRPVYKGLLAGVSEHHRGHRAHVFMQAFIFSLMDEEEIVLDNTTQLTNVPIIRNHIVEGRSLHEVGFTFLRSRTEFTT